MFYLLNLQETMVPVLETPKEEEKQKDIWERSVITPQSKERSAIIPQFEEKSAITPQSEERSNITPQSDEKSTFQTEERSDITSRLRRVLLLHSSPKKGQQNPSQYLLQVET